MEGTRRRSIYQLSPLLQQSAKVFLFTIADDIDESRKRVERNKKRFLYFLFFLLSSSFFSTLLLLLFAFQFSICFSLPIPPITSGQTDWLNICTKDKYTRLSLSLSLSFFFLVLSLIIDWWWSMIYYIECMFCFSNVSPPLSMLPAYVPLTVPALCWLRIIIDS